jgi:monofunctional glycosyltransferase
MLRLVWRLLLLTLIALTLVQFWFLACVWYWSSHNPETTAFMRGRIERLREERSAPMLRQQWVPYRNISIHLKRAVIAAEDATFVEHRGFDWKGMRLAMEKNLREGEVVAGGSTITQQLAKNLFLSPSRNPVRKLRELIIARRLEAALSKARILEIYLNVIEWGDGIWGAEAASRTYFGVPASALSAAQAALLAGAIINPRLLNPAKPTPRLLRRQRMLLARMGGVTPPAPPPPVTVATPDQPVPEPENPPSEEIETAPPDEPFVPPPSDESTPAEPLPTPDAPAPLPSVS